MKPVALVTGAANNIGAACARRLAATYTVILADRADAGPVADEIGGIAVQGDITSEDQCRDMLARAEQHGPLKVLIHSAGITKPACRIEEITLADWEQVMRVNLTGSFILTKWAAPVLRRAGGGSMVLITSRAGKTGFAALGVNNTSTKAHYCASKAGVISLTKSLALELAADNIRVNGVAPGPIEGTMIPQAQWETIAQRVPLHRLGTPAGIADACAFLCSEEASFITGHVLDVNGGTLMD